MKKVFPEAVVLCAILIVVSYGFAQTWTMSTPNLGVLQVGSTTMSADGKEIIAVGSASDPIIVSTNYGATWTNISYTPNFPSWWSYLAASADETKLMLVLTGAGGEVYPDASPIWISTNSANSWIQTTAPSNHWSALASSADGTKLYAAVNGGPIYCSTNSGNSWQTNGWPSKSWTSIATSADGTKVFAAASDLIYLSTNSGLTCVTSSAPNTGWSSICSSADGTFLAAAGNVCYISTNSGARWTTTGKYFHLVSCSANGSKLIASIAGGYIYLSTDYGKTWVSTNTPPSNPWSYVGCSADGNEFVAGVGGGGQTYFWVLKNTPTPKLNLASSNTNLALSWLIPSTNFVVQQSPDLISWSSLTDAPAFNFTNLNYSLPLSPSNSTSFFRLISQ